MKRANYVFLDGNIAKKVSRSLSRYETEAGSSRMTEYSAVQASYSTH